MRTWRPVARSRARIAAVASKPAHDRHLQVHQHEVERLRVERRERLAAVPATVTSWPRRVSRPDATRWLTTLSSTSRTRTRGARRPGQRAGASPSPAGGAGRWVAPQRALDRGEQVGRVDRLGEIRRDAQLGAARPVAGFARRGQHHDGRAGQLRLARRSPPRPRSRPCSGMLRRAGRARTAVRPAPRPSARSSASRPLCDGRRRHAPAGRPARARMRRLTSLSSTMSTRRCGGQWLRAPAPRARRRCRARR